MLTIGSLFSGIGGLELGLERAGLGPVLWQVEQSAYCRSILARHWPDAKRFDDVRTVGAANLRPIDLICGGFPCQDISFAGKGAGLAGAQSSLWFEFARIVREVRPRFVVVENVAGLATRGLDAVLGTLAALGFDAEWSTVSACAVGAPHLRQRLFVVAHSNQYGKPAISNNGTMARMPADARGRGESRWDAFSGSVRMANGTPCGMVRTQAIGNAVVPACAEVVGHVVRAIMEGK